MASNSLVMCDVPNYISILDDFCHNASVRISPSFGSSRIRKYPCTWRAQVVPKRGRSDLRSGLSDADPCFDARPQPAVALEVFG